LLLAAVNSVSSLQHFSEEIITFSGLWNHPFCSAFRSSQCMLFAQVIFVCLSRQDFAAVEEEEEMTAF
jgi:hypothetical protein